MDKKQREARRHQEDMALNRGLLWVGAAIILEFLLLLINRYYINFRVDEASVNLATTLHTLLKVVRIGGLPYCAWSGLCCASGKVKNWCFRWC